MYNYQDLENLWARKQKSRDYKRISHSIQLLKDGNTFLWRMHGTIIGHIEPDNTMTLYSGGWISSPTTRTRLYELSGLSIFINSKKYERHEQPVRIGRYGKDSLPWMEGMRCRNREVLDVEKHVDRVRVLNPERRLELQKKLRPLAKLARVGAKMDILTGIEGSRDVNLDEPTMIDAFNLATTYGGYKNQWWYTRSTPAEQLAYRMNAVNHALRKFTEKLYLKMDAYDIVEVKHG